MTEIIKVPRVNANDDTALVTFVLAEEGEKVSPGQLIGQIETTKASVDLESDVEGYFYPAVQIGQSVHVEEHFGVILNNPDERELEAIIKEQRVALHEIEVMVSDKARTMMKVNGLTETDFEGKRWIRVADVQKVLNGKGRELPEQFIQDVKAMDAPLIIYGAGRHGLVVLDTVLSEGHFNPCAFVDDNAVEGQSMHGVPVINLDKLRKLSSETKLNFHVAIGDKSAAEKSREVCVAMGMEATNVIHSSATVSKLAVLGVGVYVGPNVVIGPDAHLGDMSHVNNGTTIAHHSKIGRFVRISDGSHVAGAVQIGDDTLIGVGCSVNKDVKIGKGCTVVSGVTVFDDVEDYAVLRADGSYYFPATHSPVLGSR